MASHALSAKSGVDHSGGLGARHRTLHRARLPGLVALECDTRRHLPYQADQLLAGVGIDPAVADTLQGSYPGSDGHRPALAAWAPWARPLGPKAGTRDAAAGPGSLAL